MIRQDRFTEGARQILAASQCRKEKKMERVRADLLCHRELVAGKGFLFSDRGETELRGFEDPVRLYEVSWQERE